MRNVPHRSAILGVAVDKVLPAGTRRRLLAKLVFTVVKSPRRFLSSFNVSDSKTFLMRLRTTNPVVLENMVDQKLATYTPRSKSGIVASPKLVRINFSEPAAKARVAEMIDLEQCSVCGNLYKFPPPNVVNLRETRLCQNCRAIKRNLDVAKVLLNAIGSNVSSLSDGLEHLKKLRIYLLESYGAIYSVLSKSANLVCSEFWDTIPRGTVVGNVRCEDVQDLTFPDDSFDVVIAEDIFEHIPNPNKGFEEIYRVLKRPGYFIFTVPFAKSLTTSRRRAMVKDNRIHHILPPMYHGDRLRQDGIIVFTDFGLDLAPTLEEIGFAVETFEDLHPEYAGGYNIVFLCSKKHAL